MKFNKSGKYRLISFCIIITLSCIRSVRYTYDIYDAMNFVRDTDSVADITFDGEDFSLIVVLCTIMLNGFIAWFTVVFHTVGNAFAFLLLYLAAVKDASYISAWEISLTRKIIWSSLIVSFVVAIVLTKWDFALDALWLFWQMPVAANLIYLLGLKSRYKTLQKLG